MLLLQMVMRIWLALSHLRTDLAHDLGVGDFPAVLGWDLVAQDGEEGVGTFEVFAFVGTVPMPWHRCPSSLA